MKRRSAIYGGWLLDSSPEYPCLWKTMTSGKTGHMKNLGKEEIQIIFQMGSRKDGTLEQFGGTQKFRKKTCFSEKWDIWKTRGNRGLLEKNMRTGKSGTFEKFEGTQKFVNSSYPERNKTFKKSWAPGNFRKSLYLKKKQDIRKNHGLLEKH